MSHGDKTSVEISLALRIRLGCDTLVALAGSTRLVGVYSGNKDQLVLNPFI